MGRTVRASGRDQHREPGSEQGNDAGVAAHVVPVEDAGVEVPLARTTGAAARTYRGSRRASSTRPTGGGEHHGMGGEKAAARVQQRVQQPGVGEAQERVAVQALVRHQQRPAEHGLPGQDLGQRGDRERAGQGGQRRRAAGRRPAAAARRASSRPGSSSSRPSCDRARKARPQASAAPGRGASRRGGVGRFAQPQVGPEGQGRGEELQGMRPSRASRSGRSAAASPPSTGRSPRRRRPGRRSAAGRP